MLGLVVRSAAKSAAIAQIREAVRSRFGLAEEAVILVAEIACASPGCPPLETVIAFWANERRYHYKVFKPVAEVTGEDLPPRWFLSAMAVPQDFECTCC